MKSMNRIVFIIFFQMAVIAAPAIAQKGVGIGTTDPDGSAVLDVVAAGTPRGLLIPRLSTDMRRNIANPASGLMVFDTDLHRFCFYSGGWYMVNSTVRLADNDPDSIVSHDGDFTASGKISGSDYGLNTTGNGPVPKGGIIMWSGSVPPQGWALCDGSNGTPDLRGRFIVSSGLNQSAQSGDLNPTYAVGDKNGYNNIKLQSTNLPRHTHAVTGGSHSHTVVGQRGGDNNDHNNRSAVANGDKGVTETSFNEDYTTSATSHTHTVSYAGGNAAGIADPFDNRPPYYALAFIMKL
jgi:microcystin-dependent protein